jgi:hypothetical protein
MMRRLFAVPTVVAGMLATAPVAHADESGYLQQVQSTTTGLFSASNAQLLQLGYIACAAFGDLPHTPQNSLLADEAVARAAYQQWGLRTGLPGSRFVTDAADDHLC